MSLPEALLWRELKAARSGHRFRRQHPAGGFVLDFFCARANLAVEIDGIAHDMDDRPEWDRRRDEWLRARRIDTVRLAAVDVLRDPAGVAEMLAALVGDRLVRFGKAAPPSALRAATSPSQDDGEEERSSPLLYNGEVASRSDDGGAAA